MYNFTKKFAIVLLAVLMCLSMAACSKSGQDSGDKSYDIVVWVSESEGVKELTQKQIDRFAAAEGVKINATIEGISEADSATTMITSVEDGADIFCFSQDQLARLVQAGALQVLGDKAGETVRSLNDAGAVAAATVAGKLYCYPMTSDNGYFMYYDKSVVKEEHIDSLEDIIADCEAAGKMFSFELETSAWYNVAFFFGTGCVSNWTTNDKGVFTSVDDTFGSDAGVTALLGMQKLLKSSCYNSSSSAADFSAAVPSAVLVSGTWASADVKAALGDNYGVADLPSFTVDGQSYHLGSFTGNKLMGVKPQTDAEKGAVLQKLALYLTNEECQLERFDLKGWGPSNLAAQQSEKVANDPTLSALLAQAAYGTPQGQIHGSWWDIAKTYCTAAKEAATGDKAALKAAVDAYEAAINGLFSMSEEEMRAFTVIGGIAGTSWDTDFPMKEEPTGTWTSEVLDLHAGEELKVRQGASWDVAFGAADGGNFKVEADGKYVVVLVFDEANGTGTIELKAQ